MKQHVVFQLKFDTNQKPVINHFRYKFRWGGTDLERGYGDVWP